MSVLSLERSDRRVLGAIRFLDNVTGEPIRHPLNIVPIDPSNFFQPIVQPELDIRPNRRGDYVLFNAPGLAAYRSAFFPFPPPESVPIPIASIPIPIAIIDPTGYYLPRQFTLRLPRDSAVPPVDATLSVFEPINVTLYRSPTASVEPNWSVIRATVVTQEEDAIVRLPWALVELTPVDDATPVGSLISMTTSMADWRGEVLIAVPGVPVVVSNDNDSNDDDAPSDDSGDDDTPVVVDDSEAGDGLTVSDSAVVVREVNVQLQVFVDQTLRSIPQDEDLLASDDPNAGYIPNPDEPGTASDPLVEALMAGRDRSTILTITLP